MAVESAGLTEVGNCTIVQGDCLESLKLLPDESIQCCVTSPPYFGLRDYGHAGQLGLEKTPDEYVAGMVRVFREVRRVLRGDGVLWLNLGDSYAAQRGGTAMPAETLAGGTGGKGGTDAHRGHGATHAHRNAGAIGLKHKDLIGIPWRVAFALQADGWYLRQDIIWHKPNPMPESVTDRCTKAHEYVFMLTKNAKYYFDSAANQVPASSSFAKDKRHITGSNDNHDKPGFAAAGAQDSKGPHRVFSKRSAANSFKRPAKEAQIPGQAALQHRTDRAESTYDVMTANRRSVWTVTTKPFKGAHFATFPPDLIEPCVLTSSRPGDMVLDPFGGAGTTGVVAQRHGRPSILLELNADYCRLIEERLKKEMGNGQTTRV